MLEIVHEYFVDQRYDDIERNKTLSEVGLTVDIYAVYKGSSMGILPYGDYYFVHDFDQGENTLDRLTDAHQKARQWVNANYNTPKFLRMVVPNITTIAISQKGFAADMRDDVLKGPPSAVRGELEATYLIDLAEKHVYSQGIDLTYISGEARLAWRNQRDYKKTGSQNRAYYTVHALAVEVFRHEIDGLK